MSARNNATILVGDVRKRLAEISDKTVQCCITSPPYWGLRDYGTATWKGGDPHCDHKVGRFEYSVSGKQASNSASAGHQAHDVCPKCSAARIDSQIGLESTPEQYVNNMVAVFREVWRILADDGVLWLNLGDSYNNKIIKTSQGAIKPKDLVGIPWRVAFALQQDGWYLRQDIIWHKPNPMPESITDRCTKSHEYLFMLTKSARYFFDKDAILEPLAASNKQRLAQNVQGQTGSFPQPGISNRSMNAVGGNGGRRNRRSVWQIPTKPFKGAHFAVMPEALVEPCILATSKPNDTVLDPFAGSGTVAVVSFRHGRNFVGTELNPEYALLAEKRIAEAQCHQPTLF